jgi:hypothetical protein
MYMYICTHVCMYVSAKIYVYVYVYVYTCVTYVCVLRFKNKSSVCDGVPCEEMCTVCGCVYIYMYVYVHVHYIHDASPAWDGLYLYIHTYIHTYIRIPYQFILVKISAKIPLSALNRTYQD